MKQKIWLSSPHMGGSEQKYIQEAFDANWVAPQGNNITEFEKLLCKYTGAEYVAVLSSGTAAIHLALIVLGVKPGDEVIVSTFTFSASVNPIVYQGAMPILVDSEVGTWNINPAILEEAIVNRISKGKKPKAIIAVHLYGMPARLEEILSIGEKYEIPVIEDAAEAMGSRYNGRALGTFGLLGVLSFNGNKIITTSGGGALISNNKDLIVRSRFLSTQAREDAPHYQHVTIGYNYRMSNILAGIGRGQMEVIDLRVKQRRLNHQFYRRLFSNINGVTFQEEPDSRFFSNRWLTTINVDPELTEGITREDIRHALDLEFIESRPLWKPMHLQPVFKDCPYYGGMCSEKLFENGLCLPSGTNLSQADFIRIEECIRNMFNK